MKNTKGYVQGDMKATVEDYQKPMTCYSQVDAGKTNMYIERENKIESKEGSQLRSQDYKGRYS